MTFEVFGPRDPGPLTIAEYSDGWPRRFERERTCITGALGAHAQRIEHIGSTSVPGLAAKPIIDVLVVVADIDDEHSYAPSLVAAGYVLRVRETGHLMFRTPERDVHVHLYGTGDPEIDEVLVFRDWLRANAEDRRRYELLKRELAPRDWHDMQAYADAKGPLIAEIKARASGATDHSSRRVRLGVIILPEHRWPHAQALWRRAEELGFDHAWTYDHLAWRSLRDATWFGAIPTLTAAACVTTRIRLGTLVASPNFRHPVPFAKELLTLDDVSAGRLTAGIGAGSEGWDATTLGAPLWSRRERSDRFVEFVECTDLLLREPAASYRGRYYSADEARTYPGCVQLPRVPFAIAAAGPRAMRLAAALGETWVTTGDRTPQGPLAAAEGAEVVREQMQRVDDACAALGREAPSLRRLVVSGAQLDPGLASVEAFVDTVGRYEEVGVTDFVVHWPRADDPFAADVAVFEAAVTTRLSRA